MRQGQMTNNEKKLKLPFKYRLSVVMITLQSVWSQNGFWKQDFKIEMVSTQKWTTGEYTREKIGRDNLFRYFGL